MNEAVRQKVWKIADVHAVLADQKENSGRGGHGISHVRRVHANFETWLSSFSPDEKSLELVDALEAAVILHDIGNSVERKGHAQHSAEILDQLFSTGVLNLPNKDLVRRIVANHSSGLEDKATDFEDACVGLIVVFDHLDTIGSMGMLRVFKDWIDRVPAIYDDFWAGSGCNSLLEYVGYFFDHPTELGRQYAPMKDKSLLGNLLFNYCATFRITRPVWDYMSLDLIGEINKRSAENRSFIEGIVRNVNQFSL